MVDDQKKKREDEKPDKDQPVHPQGIIHAPGEGGNPPNPPQPPGNGGNGDDDDPTQP